MGLLGWGLTPRFLPPIAVTDDGSLDQARRGNAFMDELRRQAVTVAERWSQFSRGKRFAMTSVLVACVVGFSFVIGRSTSSDWQPVCGGRKFTGKEIAVTQAIWRQQGLKNFRKVDEQLCVPQNELSRYEALVPQSKSEEAAASSEWEKQLARTNVFSTSEVVEQHRDNALRNELRRLIKAIPAIADADVIWARSKGKSAFSNRPKVTATVNVTPHDGYDVTPELAQSLRTAVANMVSDLNAQDVVVLDQSTGLAITDQLDATITQQQRRRQLERLGHQVESKIASALSQIPGAIVKVTPVASHKQNHFVARPIQSSEVTRSSNSIGKSEFLTPIFWTHEAPADVVTFANHANQESSAALASSMIPNASENSSLESNDAQQHLRVTVTVPADYFETRTVQSIVENGDSTAAIDAECVRLQHFVTNLLPTNVPVTEVLVQPAAITTRRMDDPETQSAIAAFAAWPHAICFFVGVAVMSSFARTRRRSQTPTQASPQPDSHDQQVFEPDAAAVLVMSHNQSTTCSSEFPAYMAKLAATELTIKSPAVVTETHTQTDQGHRLSASDPTNDAIQYLLEVEPRLLAAALQHERSQAIAVLLTRFSSRLASETLAGLPTATQIEVIRRLKSLGEVPAVLVDEIAHTVARRLQSDTRHQVTQEQPTVNRIAHLFESPTSSKVFV